MTLAFCTNRLVRCFRVLTERLFSTFTSVKLFHVSQDVYGSSDPTDHNSPGSADASGSSGQPRRRGNRTKDRILAAALQQFRTNGYEATSVRSIADQLGVTTPALYYHFPNKEAILLGVVAPYFEDMADMVANLDGSDDPRALLRRYAAILNRHRDIARFVYRDLAASNHPKIKRMVDSHLGAIRQYLLGPDQSLDARVRVAAALGALRRPFLWLDEDLDPALDTLADIGAGILADNP